MTPSLASFSHLNQDDVRKACFATRQSEEHHWRQPTQEYIGENFMEIHGLGQRKSKYMEFPDKKAPLINRLACTHTQAFCPLPLGDNKVNKALAASFATKNDKGPSMCKMDGTTCLDDDYPEYDIVQMRKAKQKLQKPAFAFTHTVCPAGPLQETKTHYGLKFSDPNTDEMDARNPPAKPPTPGLYLGGAPRDVAKKTNNMRTHTLEAVKPRRVKSQPGLSLTAMAPVDPEVLTRQRVGYMAPGQ